MIAQPRAELMFGFGQRAIAFKLWVREHEDSDEGGVGGGDGLGSEVLVEGVLKGESRLGRRFVRGRKGECATLEDWVKVEV